MLSPEYAPIKGLIETKIWIESEFESRIIQGLLFNAGYTWPGCKKILEGVKFIRIGDSKILSRTRMGNSDRAAFLNSPENTIHLSTLKDLMPEIVKFYTTGKNMNKHPLAKYIGTTQKLIGGFRAHKDFHAGEYVTITDLPFESTSANKLSVPIVSSDGKSLNIDIAFLFTPDVTDAVKRHLKTERNAARKSYEAPRGREAIKSISSQPSESIIFFTTWFADDQLVGKKYKLINQNIEIMCVGKSNIFPNGEGMIYQMRGEFYSFNATELINDIVTHHEFYDIFCHNATAAMRISTDLNEFPVKIKDIINVSDSSGSIAISEPINDGTSIVMPNVTKVKANKEITVGDNSPTLKIPIMPIKAKKPKRPIYIAPNTIFIGTKRINNNY